VNRGVAAAPGRRYLLVSNPDVVVHEAPWPPWLHSSTHIRTSQSWALRSFGRRKRLSVATRVPELLARRAARVAGTAVAGKSVHASVPVPAPGWIG